MTPPRGRPFETSTHAAPVRDTATECAAATDLQRRPGCRPPRPDRNDAAQRVRPVRHRSGTASHVDALERRGIREGGAGADAPLGRHAPAVDEQQGAAARQAANRRNRGVAFGDLIDAWHGLQRLQQVLGRSLRDLSRGQQRHPRRGRCRHARRRTHDRQRLVGAEGLTVSSTCPSDRSTVTGLTTWPAGSTMMTWNGGSGRGDQVNRPSESVLAVPGYPAMETRGASDAALRSFVDDATAERLLRRDGRGQPERRERWQQLKKRKDWLVHKLKYPDFFRRTTRPRIEFRPCFRALIADQLRRSRRTDATARPTSVSAGARRSSCDSPTAPAAADARPARSRPRRPPGARGPIARRR